MDVLPSRELLVYSERLPSEPCHWIIMPEMQLPGMLVPFPECWVIRSERLITGSLRPA